MVPLCYHFDKREIGKEYNELCVLGTHRSILIYKEEIK